MNQFSKALNDVKNYAAMKSTMETLRHVKLELHNDLLTLTTADWETTAVTSISMFGENFAITTDLKNLESVVKGMVDPIQLSVDFEKLIVSDKNSKAILPTLPISEFPDKLEKGKWLGYLDLAPIKRVWSFASSGHGHPVLQYILVKLVGSEAIFMAVDGYKLVSVTTEFRPADDFEPTEFLVSADVLAKLSGREHLDASVSVFSGDGSSHATFRMNNFELTVILGEGQFPDYNQVIPANFSGELVVGVKSWKDALKMLTLIAGDDLGITRGHVEGDSLVISVKDGEEKIADKAIPIFSIAGNVPPFGLLLKHIKPVLDACATKNIRVKFGSPSQTQSEGGQSFTKSPLVFGDEVDNADQFLGFIATPKTIWQAVCMPVAL